MHPLLFTIPDWVPLLGGKALHTYGALVALGFFVGMQWIRSESKRVGLNPERALDLFFYVVLAAIVGSRVLYVFASVPEWWRDPLVFIRFWEGGLVFYGGLIGAVLTSIWYTRKHKIPFFKVADVFTPGIAIGHAIGRLGCIAAGCCFGREAPLKFPFTFVFPDGPYALAPIGIPLYPVQLFEAMAEALIFLLLFWFRKKKKFDGEVFLLYIIIYPVVRAILETFRGDTIRGFIIDGVLSTSQFISIIWVVIATIVWLKILRGKKT